MGGDLIMRVTFEAYCEKCNEEYTSSRPLPVAVEKIDCGSCEEIGTSKILKITKSK